MKLILIVIAAGLIIYGGVWVVKKYQIGVLDTMALAYIVGALIIIKVLIKHIKNG